jgi:hypothetical protein
MKQDTIVVALMLVAGAGIAAVLVYVGHEVGLRDVPLNVWSLCTAPAVWLRASLKGVMSNPNTIVSRHSFTVTAVVCEDGSAHLLGVTVAVLPEGIEIIGHGTLQHPLNVKLSGPYAPCEECVLSPHEIRAKLVKTEQDLGRLSKACEGIDTARLTPGFVKALDAENAGRVDDTERLERENKDLLALAQGLVDTWGKKVDTDDEINGADAVESLVWLVQDAQAILAKVKP